MEIYILRHGIAEDGQAGQPDSERALTADGRKKLRTVLRVAASARASKICETAIENRMERSAPHVR